MILVTAATGPIGSAVLAGLRARGLDARTLDDHGDLLSLAKAMRDVDRLYVEQADPALTVDALSVAEQCGAYHVVLVVPSGGDPQPVEHVRQSSLRWTVLETANADPEAVAAAAVDALTRETQENATFLFGEQRANFRLP